MTSNTEPVDLFEAVTTVDAAQQLIEAGGVHRAVLPNGIEVWLVVRNADAVAALSDSRLSVRAGADLLDGGMLPPHIRTAVVTSLLTADPPDHTRLRRLVSGVFTARRIEAMRTAISALTEQLIDGFAQQDEADLMAGLAVPLPTLLISELLGIPRADRGRFRAWSTAFIGGFGTPEFAVGDVTEFVLYLRDLIALRRENPDEGLLSALIQARDDNDALTDDELTSTVFLLIIAGHDTTLNLVGNGLLLMLTHPDQAARLRAEPRTLPAAVEEFLRIESPVPTSTFRTATEPMEIGGTRIEAGEIVMINLRAANLDGSAFPDPDVLDTQRSGNRHLAFGHGIHYCLGAPLARLEGEVAIGAMLRRFPEMELAVSVETLAWRAGLLVHGLVSLPVRLRRSAQEA